MHYAIGVPAKKGKYYILFFVSGPNLGPKS